MRSLFQDPVRRRILARVERLEPGTPHRWGRMTCPQAVCHMSDAFRGALGDIPVARIDKPLLRTAGRYLALYMPMRWPHGVRSAPEYAQDAAGTPPAGFLDDRAELGRLIDRFFATRGVGLQQHPMFWEMSVGEWGRWGFRHTDHHLRQFGV